MARKNIVSKIYKDAPLEKEAEFLKTDEKVFKTKPLKVEENFKSKNEKK